MAAMPSTPKKKKPAKAPAGKAPVDDGLVSQALELYKQLEEAKGKMRSAELKAFRKKKEDWKAEVVANKVCPALTLPMSDVGFTGCSTPFPTGRCLDTSCSLCRRLVSRNDSVP